MNERVPVSVHARDPISQAGITTQLKERPELRVVENGHSGDAAVAIVVADEVDEETTRIVRAVQRNTCPRVVLVATRLDDGGLLACVEAGARGLLRRSQASPEQLVAAIRKAAAGEASVPPDLLGRLMKQMGDLQRQVLAPRGLTFSGLSEREIEVLKLVADGCDTAEIAASLSYSERTIKNIIRDVVTRFQLKNRSHAVAYALREGLI